MSIRIHPAYHQSKSQHQAEAAKGIRLTVWKRSSMSFQGTDGFTVFDELGRLVFRVDNYSRKRQHDVLLLMDGVGNALLTLKPQPQVGILSTRSYWSAYRGEGACGFGRKRPAVSRVFSMRSCNPRLLFHCENDDQAEVFMHKGAVYSGGQSQDAPDFRIRGSFWKRSCKITASTGQMVATLTRKRAKNSTVLLGDDVFSLVVQPGFDPELIMAFLVVVDRISQKPFTPSLCS